MRLLIRGRNETARSGVDRFAVEPGNDAAGRLAQGDSGGEMNAVTQVAVGDVGGAAPSRDPGHGQGGGDDAGAEPFDESFVGEHPSGRENPMMGKRRVEIDVDQSRLSRWGKLLVRTTATHIRSATVSP